MVYVTSFLGPTQLAICNWKLVTGALEQGYIYELHITALSLSCLFVAIETAGKGCDQATPLIWCLMQMPQYS